MKAVLDLIECSILDARDPVPLRVVAHEERLPWETRQPWEHKATQVLRGGTNPSELAAACGITLQQARVWLDAQVHAARATVARKRNSVVDRLSYRLVVR